VPIQGQRIMVLVPIARGFVRWLQHSGETSVNDPKVKGSGQRTQYSSYGQLLLCISDVSFTPERIRGSGSSKGTTGSDSDQKERIH
ncbi:hypothetical protein AVEN_116014-1, partial [Araneus ventricosus]